MPPCYDKLASLRVVGQTMAAADGYRLSSPGRSWTQVHPDWRARLVIEYAYLLEIFEHDGDTGLAAQARIGMDEAVRKYFPHGS